MGGFGESKKNNIDKQVRERWAQYDKFKGLPRFVENELDSKNKRPSKK